MFLYILLLFAVKTVIGFVEVGVYSSLKQSQSFNQPKTINGWNPTGRPGLYSHDASSTAFSDVRVAVGGVYYVSTSLIFHSTIQKSLKASILVNNDSKRKTGLTCFEFTNSSITASGLVQLAPQESLSVHIVIQSGSAVTILPESTFFVQLLYSLTVYPAFQAVSSRDSDEVAASNWHRMEGWTSAFELQSGFSESIGTYCTSCVGIYSIQGNILLDPLQSLNNSVGIFLRNQTVISEALSTGRKRRTVSFGGVFRLRKGDCIDIRTLSLDNPHKVIKDSGYSLFYLSKHETHSESKRLNAPAPTLSTAGLYNISGWTTEGSSVYFKSSPTTMMTDNVSYKVQTQGNYLISALVNLQSTSEKQSENIWLLIIINKKTSSRFSDASIVSKKPISLMTSLYLNGVLFLSGGDTVTVCIYKDGASSIIPQAGSLFSIAMIQKDWPGMSAIFGSSKTISTAGWNELGGWETGNLANGLFSFDGAFNAVSGRYVVPLQGTYIVSCVINLNGRIAQPIQVMIAVDGQLDKSSGLHSIQYSGQGRISVPITGSIRLLPNKFLSVFVHVSPGMSWTIDQYSSFTVSLSGGGKPDSFAFHGVKTQTTSYSATTDWKEVNGWLPRDSFNQSPGTWDSSLSRFSPSEDGLYLITANLVLSQNQTTSVFSAMIIPDGHSNKYSGGQNYQRVQSLITSPWTFTLPVSCTLKLTRAQFVGVYVKSSASIAWSIAGNSTLSIVYMSSFNNPDRGSLNAITEGPDLLYGKDFDEVRHWTFSDSDSVGTFKDQMVFVKDYMKLSEYTEVKRSGLYFIGVALRAESFADSLVSYGLALCIVTGSTTTVVFRSNKFPEGAKNTHFGISTFAVLYLTKDQKVSVCLSGGENRYDFEKNYAGFSLVKIVPRSTYPGLRQVSNAATSSSDDWVVVSDWTSGGMNSLYKQGGISSSGVEDLMVSPGTFFISSSFLLENSSSLSGEFCVGQNQCSNCYLQSTTSNGGVNLAGLVRFQSNQNITSCFKRRAVSLSRSAQLLPTAGENSSFLYRHAGLSFNSAGENAMTNWISEDGKSHNGIAITQQGLYIVTVNIVLRSTKDTQLKLTTVSTMNGKTVQVPGLNIPLTWKKANDPMALGLSCLVRVQVGALLSVKVHSDSSNSWRTESNATFSAGLVTTESSFQGMAVRIASEYTVMVTSDWMSVESWDRLDIGLVSQSSVLRQGRFVAGTNGVYVVMVTLSFSVTLPAGKESNLELLLSVDGNVAHNNNLIMTRTLKGQDGASRSATLSLSSSMYLFKWQAVFPMIRSSSQGRFMINENSTFFVVLVDKQKSFSQGCNNVGPRIILQPLPFQRVAADVNMTVSLACDAVADGKVTYQWLRNNEILVETSPNIVFNNTLLSDSGRYMCIAKSSNITVTSYPAVVEVFDTSPQFSKRQYEVSVNETKSRLSLLVLNYTALTKTEEKATVSFDIFSGNMNGSFTLKQSISTNEVTLTNTKPLDYEQTRKYQLTLKAINTNTSKSSFINVTISIRDVNDNYPRFLKNIYNTTIAENVSIGYDIIQVQASDADAGSNAQITYHLDVVSSSALANQSFSVNETSGVIYTTKQIDYDTLSNESIRLRIVAKDGGTPALQTSVNVFITITDVNDNYPQFQKSVYTVTLNESAKIGYNVIRVQASDADAGSNAQITYHLDAVLSSAFANQSFSVNETTGVIYTTKQIDYDTLSNKSIRLRIVAKDSGTPALKSSINVIITITDVNDNCPQFQSSIYNATFPENVSIGYDVIRVQASDADAGSNARITYHLDAVLSSAFANQSFSVNKTSGVIYTTKKIDYDTLSNESIRLRIVAKDGGTPPLQTSVNVIITITDVNDNYPKFQKSIYNVTLNESAKIGYNVIRVQASDADDGVYALITYYIDSANHTFAINTSTGVIYTTQSFDYENLDNKSMELRVAAKDGGSPPLVSYVTVVIMVTDDNDNVPVFRNLPNEVSVGENTPENQVLFTVIAEDNDSGSNSLLQYTIDSVKENSVDLVNQDLFAVNSTSGQLFAIKAFPKNVNTKYDVTMVVKDHGRPPLSSRGNLTIIVLDVNDFSPKFQENVYERYFTTPPRTGDLLQMVKAVDVDFGNNSVIDYEITVVNETDSCQANFSITSNGSIYSTVDLKENCQYTLLVEARDRGVPSRAGECHVIIRVAPKQLENDTGAALSPKTLAIIFGAGFVIAVVIFLGLLYIYYRRRRSSRNLLAQERNSKEVLYETEL